MRGQPTKIKYLIDVHMHTHFCVRDRTREMYANPSTLMMHQSHLCSKLFYSRAGFDCDMQAHNNRSLCCLKWSLRSSCEILCISVPTANTAHRWNSWQLPENPVLNVYFSCDTPSCNQLKSVRWSFVNWCFQVSNSFSAGYRRCIH